MTMKKMILLLLCTFLALSNLAWSAPLNQSQVPADAKWLIHLDIDAFTRTQMWQLINQEIDENLQKKINAITNLLGSDPTRDIYGATLYGIDANEENAVFMIYGRFDREKLISLLVLNEAYAESDYQGQKLYHWLDEKDNKHKVGIFAADDLIVISQSEKAVTAQVDLLSGQTKALADQDDAPLAKMVDAPEKAFLLLAADGLAELSRDIHHVAVLKNSKMMAALVSEDDANMNLSVDLTAQSTEAAIQIENVLNGIKSFVELKHAEQPEILALLQAVTLVQNENQLFLNAQFPSEKLFEIIKNHKNKKASGEDNL